MGTYGVETLNSVLAALVTAGVAQSTTSGADWMIYVGMMQDISGGDRAICLYETPGRPPLEAWAIDYPNFQVVVRGKPDDYTAVRNKIQDAYYALHAQEAAIDGANVVYCYAMQSGPLPLGVDEKRRIRLAWNFRMMRNRPS